MIADRVLGRTGIRVSPLGLGTMVLGAWGNTDHDECVRVIHRALDAGINLVDTADVYAAGESEEIVGARAEGQARRRRAGDEVPRTDGLRRQRAGQLEALDHAGDRGQPAPARHRPRGPVPDPPARSRHGDRGDDRRADGSRPGRQDPRRGERRRSPLPSSSRRAGRRNGATSPSRTASSRPTRSSTAASNVTSCRCASATGSACSCGARWRAGG